MLKVTLPNGKTYTYAQRNAAKARALAAKTGGTLTASGFRARYECACPVPTCGGCDYEYDAHRERVGRAWHYRR